VSITNGRQADSLRINKGPASLITADVSARQHCKRLLPSKIRFSDLSRGLWQHLLDRVHGRKISLVDLERLQEWVRSQPVAPDGDWYKDFGSFKLCGSGEFARTVLTREMKPFGEEIA
jgi:hypothetical protein